MSRALFLTDHRGELVSLVGLIPLLERAQREHYAVGAFNYCNAEIAQAIVEQASALRSPVLLLTAPWEGPLLGTEMLVEIARFLAARTDVPVCLHLDHAADPDLIDPCIEAGFSSVMIDGSRHDFEENVRVTRSVVERAHARGVTVEGELGAVGRASAAAVEGAPVSSLTDPDRAAEFAERTGVDALAVAIGNAHGIYTQRPQLDFERLEAIRQKTDVPLVLHGGSGTPPEQLRRAIELGITKVNIASEVGHAYLGSLRRSIVDQEAKVWYARILAEAKAAVAEVAARWIPMLGSAGRVG
jgi:ketose-bisphosphate aldolase